MNNSLESYNKFYQVSFTNHSKFPVVVESWVHLLDGLSSMKEFIVQPNQTVQVTSVTGEWYVHNMLTNSLDFAIWKEAGFTYAGSICKFRNKVAGDGKFAWFNYDGFSISRESNNYLFTFDK